MKLPANPAEALIRGLRYRFAEAGKNGLGPSRDLSPLSPKVMYECAPVAIDMTLGGTLTRAASKLVYSTIFRVRVPPSLKRRISILMANC